MDPFLRIFGLPALRTNCKRTQCATHRDGARTPNFNQDDDSSSSRVVRCEVSSWTQDCTSGVRNLPCVL